MKNIFTLLKFLSYRVTKRRPIDRGRPNCVHTISYREFAPRGGKGGAAVQSCQQILIGEKYDGLSLRYTYFEDNKYFQDWKSRIADLWGAAYFAIKKTSHERNAVYITHDFGTGFGLALLGKRFAYVAHLQGSKVEEKISFNEFLTALDKKIVQFCERYVLTRASFVCFPSVGAKNYYFSSPYRAAEEWEVKIGPTLHNTLYVAPEPTPVAEVIERPDCVSFLSVGALTGAKGIDIIPSFIEGYLNKSDNKVRWIVVGKGSGKRILQENIDRLMKIYDNFEGIIIEECPYSTVQYLMGISDIYIMLHRVSVFDLATLEAMRVGKCVLLSFTGGNVDFNVKNNIVFYKEDISVFTEEFMRADIDKLKQLNRAAYHEYFSPKCFIDAYIGLINRLLA